MEVGRFIEDHHGVVLRKARKAPVRNEAFADLLRSDKRSCFLDGYRPSVEFPSFAAWLASSLPGRPRRVSPQIAIRRW